MSKRSLFTTVTPLPAGVTRQIVVEFLHNHEEMIDLNPLVKERHPIPTPPHAPADELLCQWYSLTDKISYLPGVAGDISYTCAFNDLPNGVQTHCYAPAGLTIREKWSVGGSLPGEPAEPIELGLDLPPAGLYLREDVDMRCNVIMTSFVKKTLKKSHAALVERLKIKAQIASSANSYNANRNSSAIVLSSEPAELTGSEVGGQDSISGVPYHPLASSAPTSRPSSAGSSVDSYSSSIYSTQSSPMWSPAASSSLGASSAMSFTSPPTTNSSGYQFQPQQQRLYESVQRQFHASQPGSASVPRSEPAYITAPVPEPQTPFLRHQQPNWPVSSQQPPVPAVRPQSQAFIQAYRPPPPSHFASADAVPSILRPGQPRPSSTGSGRALPDEALWQALGGRRPGVAAVNATSYRANGQQQQQHQQQFHARSRSQGHPDYPQLNPYEDGGDDRGFFGPGVVPAPLRVKPPMMSATVRR